MIYYYACGDNMKEIKFNSADEAWEFVLSHVGYDCVVEYGK